MRVLRSAAVVRGPVDLGRRLRARAMGGGPLRRRRHEEDAVPPDPCVEGRRGARRAPCFAPRGIGGGHLGTHANALPDGRVDQVGISLRSRRARARGIRRCDRRRSGRPSSSTASNSGTGVSSMPQPAARRPLDRAPRRSVDAGIQSLPHQRGGAARSGRGREKRPRGPAPGGFAGADAPVEHGERAPTHRPRRGCERAHRIHAGAEPEHAGERQQPDARLQPDEAVPGRRHADGAAGVRADGGRRRGPREIETAAPDDEPPGNARHGPRRRGWAGVPILGLRPRMEKANSVWLVLPRQTRPARVARASTGRVARPRCARPAPACRGWVTVARAVVEGPSTRSARRRGGGLPDAGLGAPVGRPRPRRGRVRA